MEQVMQVYERYGMEFVGGLLFLLVIFMMIQMIRLNAVRTQLTRITNQVREYLSCVMDEERAREKEGDPDRPGHKEEPEPVIEMPGPGQRKGRPDEVQNQLISSVLEEIFP